MQNICIVINNVLSFVINVQNSTIFEPVILTAFYTSYLIKHLCFTYACPLKTIIVLPSHRPHFNEATLSASTSSLMNLS